jgi:predicted transposase/invertase (TIGR01784 family)
LTANDDAILVHIGTRFSDGRRVDVQMQARRHGGLRRRVLHYWARLYAAQLKAGQRYTELMPVFGVFILGFEELPTDRLHSIFDVRERHEGYALSSAMQVHFLELTKLDRVDWEREDPEVVYWCRFFAAQTDEELERLAMDDPEMEAAKKALDELSEDPKARQLAEDRALWHWMYDDGMATARKQGRVEGRAEGEAVGLRKAVRSVCELLEVELTAERVELLEQATAGELEQLLTALRRERHWPQ